MAIEFSFMIGQNVIFIPPSTVLNLSTFSVLMWTDITNFTNNPGLCACLNAGITAGWQLVTSSSKLQLTVPFSGSTPYWNSGTISTGIHLLCFTYDSGSIANDPLFYQDGTLLTTTEVVAPSGTVNNWSTATLRLGSVSGVYESWIGKLLSHNIYNRILSATEIAEAYATRKFIPSLRGLVFAPHLIGAAGLQTFDGATLGATNYLIDQISGAVGTPAGSPIGRADTYLTFENVW